ncbi:sorting nexin Snx12 [Schizosaccharomyces cryophilus OY26]|uniref:Sorting nexin Snx12 n=1 Tax=Schizosaccharomyces cryophilus (strain OY26 / ATCC MYA-4695 / CBS 11777 / NBRC 106824 / NRRL Y48691) TaxID=653667 RepID=S9VUF7_SCHCR|nr:sorting nexin Snx12 [Schizosaccharomyces cryophilus OY26]EPY49799.1 sorting nexin Snx12 [Schizosaccharomyces cryophilus OY26]
MSHNLKIYFLFALCSFFIWVFFRSFVIKIVYLWATGYFIWFHLHSKHLGTFTSINSAEPFLVDPTVFRKRSQNLLKSRFLLRQALCPGYPEISEEIEFILEIFMEKYVKKWSSLIIGEPTIPNSIEDHFRKCIHTLFLSVETVDFADVLIKKILPLLTKHLRLFIEAEQLVVGHKAVSFTDHSELSKEIAAKYNNGSLHKAILLSGNPMVAQKKYLRNWTIQVLSIILPNYYQTSPLVISLITEIIINAALLPLISYVSDPDFFNYLIIQGSGSIIERRRKIRRLKHAIRKLSSNSQIGARRLGLKDSQHAFDQYIREIRRISNISDARRLRSELLVQRRQLDQHTPFSSELQQYHERLRVAINTTEKRISVLSGFPFQRRQSALVEQAQSLQQILSDSAAVSCFLEFMERRHRSHLLHFWLVVEGLKESQDDPLNAHIMAPFSDIFSDYTDFTAIAKSYIKRNENPFEIPDSLVNSVYSFISQPENNLSSELWIEARNAMLAAQEHVFNIMHNDDYLEFVNSDIYYRFLAQDVISDQKSLTSSTAYSPINDTLDNPPNSSRQASIKSISSSSKSFNSSASVPLSMPSLRKDTTLNDVDLEDTISSDEEEVLFASPGDLQLSEAIEELHADIQEFENQLHALSTMMKKAELISDQKQFKSLSKSYQAIEKAVNRKKRQVDQYLSQEEDSKLYNRSRVSIDSYKLCKDENEQEYAVYTIRIERLEGDIIRSGWMVARRYREFAELHKQLKQMFPQVRSLKFPNKTVIPSITKSILEYRKTALEEYSQAIFQMPDVCDSKILRMFLSQQNVTAPQMFNPKIVGERWKRSLETLGFEVNGSFKLSQADSTSSFSAPICEFLIELFSPNNDIKQQWMPKKAYISILEQLFGGALEKRIRTQMHQWVNQERIYQKVHQLRHELSGIKKPGRSAAGSSRARKPAYADRNQLKAEAGIMLASMFPGYTPDIAVKRIFRILQNQTLNAHIIYTLLDEALEGLKQHKEDSATKP